MLDWLSVKIPFKREVVEGVNSYRLIRLNEYGLKCGAKTVTVNRDVVTNRDPDFVGPMPRSSRWGAFEVSDLYVPWDSLASSFSGLALKVFMTGNGFEAWPYVLVQCSPAKLLQGHNIYGPEDVALAFRNMVFVLSQSYPVLSADLDLASAEVRAIDITYSFRLPNRNMVQPLHSYLQKISKGHVKGRTGYDSTSYFGHKDSRYGSTKIYDKLEEIERNGFSGITDESTIQKLKEHATGLQRIEVRLKNQWFERRGIPTNIYKFIEQTAARPDLFRTWWATATRPLFEALQGQEIRVMQDDMIKQKIDLVHGDVRGRSNKVYAFYLQIKHLGFREVQETMTKSTFHRNVSQLVECGISLAALQNVGASRYADVVVQLPKLISIDQIGDHFPDDYHCPRDLFEVQGGEYVWRAAA